MKNASKIDLMKIFIAQMGSKVGDLQGNSRKIMDYYEQALRQESDICLLPELATSGYFAMDLFLKPSFIQEIEEIISELIAKTGKTALFLTAPIFDNGSLYNGVIAAQNGVVIGKSYKTMLPNYGIFDEKRYFSSGQSHVITVNGHKIGVPICEDIWHREVCLDLKNQGAELFLVPNASPFEKGKLQSRIFYAEARFKDTQVPIIYCNQAVAHDGIVFDGRSFCFDGELKIVGKAFQEDGILVPFPLGHSREDILRHSREDILRHSREDILRHSREDILRHSREGGNPAFMAPGSSAGMTPSLQEQYQAMVFATRHYVQDNGFNSCVIGLSGGIDSSLTASIAVIALGADKVRAIMLPSKFTSADSIVDAKKLADLLGIKLDIISIDPVLAALASAAGLPGETESDNIAYQNLQSRARGVMLMAESNKYSALLLTTGNKSEYATGYATIYGDMNGAFNPIKDLYKTEIFALAKYLDLPESIINKEPSAELAFDQKDSDSLPPYERLDRILELYIEQDLSFEEIAEEFGKEETLKVINLVKKSEFKRQQAAPGVKLSIRNFEKDRRYPITNGWKG